MTRHMRLLVVLTLAVPLLAAPPGTRAAPAARIEFAPAGLAGIAVELVSAQDAPQPPAPQEEQKPPDAEKQQPPQKAPSEELQKPVGPVERHVLRRIWDDQVAIWTAPLHAGGDKKWLIPTIGVAAVMFPTDQWSSRRLSGERRFEASRAISNLGSDYVNYGIAGSTYLAGKLGANQRAQEAGLLGLVSALYTSEVVRAFKIGTNRRRPKDGGDGQFWNGGRSFPSGHAGHSWAIASVIAYQYSNKPLLKWGAYSWATLVSISRLTGRNHYPSDVLIGSVMGHLIARYVVRQHGRKPRSHVDAAASQTEPPAPTR